MLIYDTHYVAILLGKKKLHPMSSHEAHHISKFPGPRFLGSFHVFSYLPNLVRKSNSKTIKPWMFCKDDSMAHKLTLTQNRNEPAKVNATWTCEAAVPLFWTESTVLTSALSICTETPYKDACSHSCLHFSHLKSQFLMQFKAFQRSYNEFKSV